MDHSRKCMSINAIVDHNTTPVNEIPLSPPNSYKSRSPTLSPNMCYTSISSTIEGRNNFQLPVSIEERRYRNKLASAKYRAKKQASIESMTARVSQLITSNSSLQRELNKVKQENELLRAILISQQSSSSEHISPSYY